MTGANIKTESQLLDYAEMQGRPVVFNRLSGDAWLWKGGDWQSFSGPVTDHGKEVSLSVDEFVHAFPEAALSLLDLPPR